MIKFIKREYEYLIFSFFIVSFTCWFIEILYSLVKRGILVFPGSMLGPCLPIYGTTFVLLVLLINKKDKIYINIIKTFLIAVIIEYIASLISDKVFNHIIWDYSNCFMNINGRVCLEMSLLFTIFGIITIYLIEPVLRRVYLKYKFYIKPFNITLIIVFILDIIINTFWV